MLQDINICYIVHIVLNFKIEVIHQKLYFLSKLYLIHWKYVTSFEETFHFYFFKLIFLYDIIFKLKVLVKIFLAWNYLYAVDFKLKILVNDSNDLFRKKLAESKDFFNQNKSFFFNLNNSAKRNFISSENTICDKSLESIEYAEVSNLFCKNDIDIIIKVV